MTIDSDVTRIVRSWLQLDEHESADRVLDNVLALLDATPQRRTFWPARRIADMNTFAKFLMAAAAVVVVAVVGINLLPRTGGDRGVGGPAVSASPSPLPSPSASPSPSPGADVWPSTFDIGRHDVTVGGLQFSFSLASSGWRSRFAGMIETGAYTTASYAWIGFPGKADGVDAVATDPCAGATKRVGPSVTDVATAMTTIPGTDAVGPSDVTLGGRPAKLVVLTIHDDIGCNPSSFWLYGPGSAYPNSLDSTIRERVVAIDGTTYSIHSDQAGPNPDLEQEIQQIIDSIQFG